MENLNYFSLDGRFFKAIMRCFGNNTFKKICYFQFFRAEDGSFYAKVVGSNEILPIYYRSGDKILKGFLMSDNYSRYYVEIPFEFFINENGLFATDEIAPFCQANLDAIDFIELSYRVNNKKKTR